MNDIRTSLGALVVLGALSLSGCKSAYEVTKTEGTRYAITHTYDAHPNLAMQQELAAYKAQIEAKMSPVIGHAAMELKVFRPESPLSNLMADILVEAGKRTTGHEVTVGIMNMGGIRSSITAGEVTYGDIFEVAPFENKLCVLKLKGNELRKLFEQIAAVHGEGLSGARLVISKGGKLLEAEVTGKPLSDVDTYWVATNDYLAEGNDKLEAFRKGTDKIYPPQSTIRQILVDYVARLEKEGKSLEMGVTGRITVE